MSALSETARQVEAFERTLALGLTVVVALVACVHLALYLWRIRR